jgi:cyclophilin family peptidyl-prolyl cis-trans isomerase/HEAT repeat protein
MRAVSAAVALLLIAAPCFAQIPAARLTILQAEERGAKTAGDLSVLRTGVRSRDGETARVAVRALGRLRRPALVVDITPALKSTLPEVRAEAANAIGEALAPPAAVTTVAIDSAWNTLSAVLATEDDANVRSTILEVLGRLPYLNALQIERAEATLRSYAPSDFVMDRLGVAKGLEALIRLQAGKWPAGPLAIAALRDLLDVEEPQVRDAGESITQEPRRVETAHDARVRRLALEALTAAGVVDRAALTRASTDTDAQVRRLGMLAAHPGSGSSADHADSVLGVGLKDPSPMVRVEALRGLSARHGGEAAACQAALDATHDPEPQVTVVAFFLLRQCGTPEIVAYLEQLLNRGEELQAPRAWVRPAHALQTLAVITADRARPFLERVASSPSPELRMHAAKVAIVLGERERLVKLSEDQVPEVRAAALYGLGGAAVVPRTSGSGSSSQPPSGLNAADLRRLAAPRARVTIRGVGVFELVLVTTEAPATVLRFARLAEAGSFDGTMLADARPALVSLRAMSADQATASQESMRILHSEAGRWPHVRGTVGLSLDEVATGGAQLFINLVDNPRYDHQLTVFAQVLNGIEIVDKLVAGDVIEKIEILP